MPSSIGTDHVTSKSALYQRICDELGELLRNETDFIANAANTVAHLFHAVPDVNWVGFYLLKGDELVLGPFQGKPACTRIPIGKGVCGTAARQRKTFLVSDVNAFPGHIACDAASQSEIVIPLLNWGKLLGVLDVDSASINRFQEEDREGFESIVSVFLSSRVTDDMPDLIEEAVGR